MKTNIGHLEAAAGIAGLIKVVLALERTARSRRTLHFHAMNPHIASEDPPLRVPTRGEDWPGDGPAVAGVSSFGFGGTNAHAILVEAPPRVRRAPREHPPGALLLALSSPRPAALADVARAHVPLLDGDEQAAADVCHTSAVRRTTHRHRLAVTGADAAELASALTASCSGTLPAGAFAGQRPPGGPPRLALVFGGQATSLAGLDATLPHDEPAFAEALGACDADIRELAGWSPLTELARGQQESRLDRTELAQPVIVAVQIALAELWRSWGIVPAAFAGHSLGEVSAAQQAGVLTRAEAMRLAVTRGRVLQAVAGDGAMAAVAIDAERVQTLAAEHDIDVAAVNGPASAVLAGEPRALAALCERLRADGVRCSALETTVAFHSRLVEPSREQLRAELAWLRPRTATTTLVSSLHGRRVAGPELDAGHWAAQARQPVQLALACEALVEHGVRTVIEVDGHPILAEAIGESLRATGAQGTSVLGSLRRGRPPRAPLLRSLAELYALGHDPDWAVVQRDGEHVALPAHPWQRQRYWHADAVGASPAVAPLDTRAPAAAETTAIRGELRRQLAAVLGEQPESLDVHTPFVELGADSVMLAEAIRAIEVRFGVRIALRRFFEDLRDLDALARFLAEHAEPAAPAPPAAGTAAADGAAALPAAAGNDAHTDGPDGDTVARVLERQLEMFSSLVDRQLATLRGAARTPAPQITPVPERTPARQTTPAAAPAGDAATILRPPRPPSADGAGPSPERARHVAKLAARYGAHTATSKTLADRHRPVLADSRASAGFLPATKELLYPIVGDRCDGALLWDVDGNEYVDIAMDFGVNLFGHRPAFLRRAWEEQLERGLLLGPRPSHAGEVATLLCELTGMERASFCQSGSEAVMNALRLARLAHRTHPRGDLPPRLPRPQRRRARQRGRDRRRDDERARRPRPAAERRRQRPGARLRPAGGLDDAARARA